MIYCWQFASLRPRLAAVEGNPLSHEKEIRRLYEKGRRMAKMRYLYKKGYVVLKRFTM